MGYVNPSGAGEGESELVRGRRVGFFCTRVEGGCFLVVSLLYLLFRRALAVAAARLRSREFKELEIVVLSTTRFLNTSTGAIKLVNDAKSLVKPAPAGSGPSRCRNCSST